MISILNQCLTSRTLQLNKCNTVLQVQIMRYQICKTNYLNRSTGFLLEFFFARRTHQTLLLQFCACFRVAAEVSRAVKTATYNTRSQKNKLPVTIYQNQVINTYSTLCVRANICHTKLSKHVKLLDKQSQKPRTEGKRVAKGCDGISIAGQKKEGQNDSKQIAIG